MSCAEAELYLSGKTIREVSELTGVSYNKVKRRLRAANVPMRLNNVVNEGICSTEEAASLYATGLTVGQVADAMGVSVPTINSRLKSAGVKIRQHWERNGRPRPTEDTIVSMYKDKLSITKIAQQTGYSRKTISKMIKSSDVNIRKRSECLSYELNHSAFDGVGEAVEYWSGFMMADGCVHKKGNDSSTIRLLLNARDIGHVDKFRAFLGCSKPVLTQFKKVNEAGKIDEFAYLVVTSERLAARLAEIGVVPQKTCIAPAKLFANSRHFWRGCVDGDGCLSKINNHYPSLGLIGAKILMEQFCEFIEENLGFAAVPRNYGSRAWTVQTYCQKAAQLSKLLYEDSTIFMDRKRERAIEAIQYLNH